MLSLPTFLVSSSSLDGSSINGELAPELLYSCGIILTWLREVKDISENKLYIT
jgi:hypothetical protein